MIGIYTDLFSSEMESVLAMVHGLELVMVAQVWVPPQSAVDHMGQTLLGPNLTITGSLLTCQLTLNTN